MTGGTPPADTGAARAIGPLRSFVAWIGSGFILALIRVLGRVERDADVPWLAGPTGGEWIGDTPYEDWGARTGTSVQRRAEQGGLVADFDELRSDAFDPARVDPRVRHFYEHTAGYRMDMWARTWFPANIALWLLVTTISRKVNQLNFPLAMLETAMGLDSEIITLTDRDGRVQWTGWYRRMVATGRAVYSGFYTTAAVPRSGRKCVKVVFPMPAGNATVILEPRTNDRGDLELTSAGRGFGDAGFYRLQRVDDHRMRVWRVRTLHETFRVYTGADGVLRCDHRIRFLGLPVLHLHYRMAPRVTA